MLCKTHTVVRPRNVFVRQHDNFLLEFMHLVNIQSFPKFLACSAEPVGLAHAMQCEPECCCNLDRVFFLSHLPSPQVQCKDEVGLSCNARAVVCCGP